MTKERRLAIQMWKEVRNLILKHPNKFKDVADLENFKVDFCKEHKLKWSCQCWFCQYLRDCHASDCCERCPLNKCPLPYFNNIYDKSCVDYHIVSNQTCSANRKYLNFFRTKFKKKDRIAACNRIIEALGGEI